MERDGMIHRTRKTAPGLSVTQQVSRGLFRQTGLNSAERKPSVTTTKIPALPEIMPTKIDDRAQRGLKRGLMLLAVTLGCWVGWDAGALVLGHRAFGQTRQKTNSLEYGELLQKIDQGEVKTIELDPTRNVALVTLKTGDAKTPIEVKLLDSNPELLAKVRGGGGLNATAPSSEDQTSSPVDLTIRPSTDNGFFWNLAIQIALVAILVLGLMMIFRRSANASNQALNFGRSRARFQMEAKTGILFDDVAGIEEAKEELQEVVTFLKKPERFTAIGARIPRGVLLVGPPGTGKTLLAKAIAGEAGVPFFSMSGSEFVEMFVGVGASRVRDLFRKAKENAPCIVFIDEIDAVGRQRGTGIGGGHDEREQTLNQLLTEMDGFEGNAGVIIIAATNRPDVLDSALLRPGRFDRQVMVDLPTVKGRLGILEVHARNKKLAPEVSLEAIARRTPGLSGADLSNLLNEAAILTARRRKEQTTPQEIEDALDRVTVGMTLIPLLEGKKKRLVAYHEVGHALTQTLLKQTELLDKVTILPRSGDLSMGGMAGFSRSVPDEDHTYFPTRAGLLARITVALAGRATEMIVFGPNEVTQGASSDLQFSTNLARRMITFFGMSDLGQVALESSNNEVFLGRDMMPRSEYSEKLATEIDARVRAIATQCYEEACRLIRENRALVDHLVDVLMERETLDGEEFRQIVAQYTELPQKMPVLL